MAETIATEEIEGMLELFGYRIEGPGDASDTHLHLRFWWTLYRDGWSGIECGADFAARREAIGDALRALAGELADDVG